MKKIINPIYSIYPTIYCSGTILVNDVPVRDWYGDKTKEGGFVGNVPINNVLLKSGKHKIVGKMHPRYNQKFITEEELMNIKFFHYEKDQFKTTRVQFSPPIESPWGGLSEGIKHPYYEISAEIEVDLPFGVEGWENSLALNEIDKEQLFKEVFRYYQQVRTVLLEHNVSKFLEISHHKMEIQQTTLYFNEARKDSFMNGASKLFSQKLKVEELIPENLKLEVLGYGKLVRLMTLDNKQPLKFKSPDPENQSDIEIEIKLDKPEIGKDFRII